MKLISGLLIPIAGDIRTEGSVYYLPQILEQFNIKSIAAALGVEEKLTALKEILNGTVTEENMAVLNDDWDLEERIRQTMEKWWLSDFTPSDLMSRLSGGQKTKVLIAGIEIHQPDIILMDEPTNHLDRKSREQLYKFIESTNKTLLVVSHDRTLLNLLPKTAELNRKEIVLYGGNYDFYKEQKQIQQNALQNSIKNTENALKKPKLLNGKFWNVSKNSMQKGKETGKSRCSQNNDEYPAK